MKSVGGDAFSEPLHMQLSFHGFYYAPISGVQVLWSIASNSTGTRNDDAKVVYNLVVYNIGNAWVDTMSSVVPPVAGFYYVNIQGTSCR